MFDRAQQLHQHIRFFSFFDALLDPIFFNKNIHREEISSLLLLLPAAILDDPEHERIFPQIIERIDTILCLEKSIYGLPAIILDLAGAAEMAVDHLIDLGHQRIGCLALNDARIDGYKRALALRGIPFDPALMRVLNGDNVLPSSYELTHNLIEAQPDITALFASNDEAAIAAMAALHDRGLRVPEDIAIASIDNIDTASIIRPALTTVNVPRARDGRICVSIPAFSA